MTSIAHSPKEEISRLVDDETVETIATFGSDGLQAAEGISEDDVDRLKEAHCAFFKKSAEVIAETPAEETEEIGEGDDSPDTELA